MPGSAWKLHKRRSLPTYIANFSSVHPTHQLTQEGALDWLSAAHARAEATQARLNGTPFDEETFRAEMRRRFARFGCGPNQIALREVELAECSHQEFSTMELYNVDRCPNGAATRARTDAFEKSARGAVSRLYESIDLPPSDLIHVTCTGYVAPSAAQRLVESKGWGEDTRVSHVYHMGCYAALPALRVAAGLLCDDTAIRTAHRRTDVVHTEICSLHFQPLLHSPEQLVVQSLFGDGFIRYAVVNDVDALPPGPVFRLLGSCDELIPGSSASMSWLASDHGMQMTLARDVPERLRAALPGFVRKLAARANLSEDDLRGAIYAVHPGGPRILDCAREALGLDESQIDESRRVLRARGNMSSATLPHVWMALLASSVTPPNALVVSLAFGPGLTLCGTVMCKVER